MGMKARALQQEVLYCLWDSLASKAVQVREQMQTLWMSYDLLLLVGIWWHHASCGATAFSAGSKWIFWLNSGDFPCLLEDPSVLECLEGQARVLGTTQEIC